MKKWISSCIFAFVLATHLLFSSALFAKSPSLPKDAVKIYEQHEPCVYQIKVLDKASRQQISLGSGFQINPEGLIASNYHVISEAALERDRYTIHFIDRDEKEHDAHLVGVDVVNDLALMQSVGGHEACSISFSNQELQKGQRIFSMGNPHDLGMLVVDGNYNGMVEDSLYQKVLFTGSINSGMSGGPAFDTDGHLVGVNVARSGDDLSFLVPEKYLQQLLGNLDRERIVRDDFTWKQMIYEQLVANQELYMKSLLEGELEIDALGEMNIPAQIAKNFKCWGTTHDLDHEAYDHEDVSCGISDYIYISSTQYTGNIAISYRWFQTKTLNTIQLYKKFSQDYKRPLNTKNTYEKNVNEFECEDDFVQHNGIEWRTGFCLRRYKDYELLYDIHVSLASLNHPGKGMRVFLWFEGVTKENGLALTKKIVENITWTK